MSDEATPDRLDLILIELGRLGTGLTAVQADLTGVKADLTGVKGDLSGLKTNLTGLETNMTNLRVDLMDRMDRLQNSLTEIRDDIGVNMGRAQAAVQANDNTREALRNLEDQVGIIWRQVKRLEAKMREITGDP